MAAQLSSLIKKRNKPDRSGALGLAPLWVFSPSGFRTGLWKTFSQVLNVFYQTLFPLIFKPMCYFRNNRNHMSLTYLHLNHQDVLSELFDVFWDFFFKWDPTRSSKSPSQINKLKQEEDWLRTQFQAGRVGQTWDWANCITLPLSQEEMRIEFGFWWSFQSLILFLASDETMKTCIQWETLQIGWHCKTCS